MRPGPRGLDRAVNAEPLPFRPLPESRKAGRFPPNTGGWRSDATKGGALCGRQRRPARCTAAFAPPNAGA